jgi:hypothetical protein
MQVNMKAVITDYDDKPIMKNKSQLTEQEAAEGKKPDQEEMMLGHMCLAALNVQLEKEKNLSAERKVHRAVLSMDIHKAIKSNASGIMNLAAEDLVEIKDLMNNIYQPLPLMRAYNLFDPKPEDAKENKA